MTQRKWFAVAVGVAALLAGLGIATAAAQTAPCGNYPPTSPTVRLRTDRRTITAGEFVAVAVEVTGNGNCVVPAAAVQLFARNVNTPNSVIVRRSTTDQSGQVFFGVVPPVNVVLHARVTVAPGAAPVTSNSVVVLVQTRVSMLTGSPGECRIALLAGTLPRKPSQVVYLQRAAFSGGRFSGWVTLASRRTDPDGSVRATFGLVCGANYVLSVLVPRTLSNEAGRAPARVARAG
ncbi:MAG: hypothetical protein ABR520_07690 [Mycobacteriales bacterium]|nr:hypothetical protein [Frankia sp.]MCA1833583.1 hypothetical protein [Actinomycetota bacterium]